MNKEKQYSQTLVRSLRTTCEHLLVYSSGQNDIEIDHIDVDNLVYLIQQLSCQVSSYVQNFQKHMQTMEENLRKHVKNQIQLKLYYEHLEEVIAELKNQQKNNQLLIDNLKSENQKLKDKDKIIPTSCNNTKNEETNPINTINYQTKLDTITKIKNRLSLNDTGEFYARNLNHKKDPCTKQLHNKRQSLASTLQKLYENQIQKPKEKSKSKSNHKSLQKNKSKKSLKNQKSRKNSPKKSEKSYTYLSSRRGSQI